MYLFYALLTLRSILVLSSHLLLCLPRGLLASDFPTTTIFELVSFSMRSTYNIYSHFPWFYYPNNVWWRIQIVTLLRSFLQAPVTCSLSGPLCMLCLYGVSTQQATTWSWSNYQSCNRLTTVSWRHGISVTIPAPYLIGPNLRNLEFGMYFCCIFSYCL